MNRKPTIEQLVRQKLLLNALNKPQINKQQINTSSKPTPLTDTSATDKSATNIFTSLKTNQHHQKLESLNALKQHNNTKNTTKIIGIFFLIIISLSSIYLLTTTSSQLLTPNSLTGAIIGVSQSNPHSEIITATSSTQPVSTSTPKKQTMDNTTKTVLDSKSKNDETLGISSEGYSLGITAVSPGPDIFGYQSDDTIAYAFDDISSTGTPLFLGDDAGTNVDMGMNFTFYGGASYNTTNISSNGYITFGGPVDASANENISANGDPNYLIAPFWDDLNPGIAGQIYVQTKGTAPNRQFIVQWHQIPPFHFTQPTVNVTFQIILYETTNQIRFYYNDTVIEDFSNSNGASATIGIENADGTDGLVYSFNTPSLYNGSSILFYKPQLCNNTAISMTLTSKLSCETATLNLTASNIFIDCAGYTINYGGSSTGTAIDIAGNIDGNPKHNITIKNCNFRQTNTDAYTGTHGAIYIYGNNVTIWNNTFIANGPSTAAAIYVVDSNFTNISNNVITQNGSYTSNGSAIFLSDVFEAVIEDNIINTTANDAYGILYSTAGNATIRRNIINTTSIGATGISLTSLVRGTTVLENRVTVTGSGGGFGSPSTNAIGILTSNDIILRSNTLKVSTANNAVLSIDTVNNSMFDNNTIENQVTSSMTNAIELIGPTQNNVLVNNNITAQNGNYEIDDRVGFNNDTVYYNYLIYNNSLGEVAWQNNGTGSLLHEMRISIAGSLSLGETIYIANNTLAINTSAVSPLGKFNSSANITLRSIGLPSVGQIHKVGNFTTDSTQIRHAGTDCNATGGCSILFYMFGTLMFNTTGFSSFAANLSVAAETPQQTSNCSTITTTTTLLNNINSVGTCITIGASHLTLNCANYLINYSQIGEAGFGINVTGYNNISIKNCIIREASVNTTGEYAITLVNAANITISNSTIQTVSSVSTGIYASNTFVMNLSSNVISTNGSSAHAIYLVNSDNATIYNNILNTTNANNNAYGINLDTTGNNTIIFNLLNTSGRALSISGKSNNNISYNNFTSMGDAGAGAVTLSAVDYNKIHFNQINSTGANVYGIYFSIASNHNIFGENTIRTKDTTSDVNAYFFRSSYNNTITHDTLLSSVSSNQIRIQASNATMINMSFNKYNVSFDDGTSGTLTVQWNVYVNVSNNTGSALTNANVTIFNVSSVLEQSALTGSDGEVTLVVTEFLQTATEKIFYSPHTIKTTNSTYTDNTTIINISNSNSTYQNIVLKYNALPTAPAYIQIDYRNLTATTNRTPIFIWKNSTDTDGDIFSYHIQVDDNAIFNNPEINVTAITPTAANANTTYYAATTLNVDTRYFWRVRANDSIGYGDWSNGATTDGPSSNQNLSNFTVDSLLQLTLTNNAVEFGTLTMGANVSSADSTTDSILPLRGENTGNIQFNITINATALFSQVAMNKSNYQFRIAENESNSFSLGLSSTSWTNMTTSTSAFHLVNLSWQSVKNDFLLHLNISLPFDEDAGLKSSSILLTVTSNE